MGGGTHRSTTASRGQAPTRPGVARRRRLRVHRGTGEPVHPDTLSSLVPILIKRYNQANPGTPLPHARLHDLRHIHATTLPLAGVPVHVVAARLGHADPSIPSGSTPT
ncbi:MULTISPECIES: tyrosine-type recombinase/integrase [unclassified Nonomuraea]|uniref:tyrosine-type recombinase/integrase n=1 Tax=unclassified Nonomuraea TaxID=2593643 RepID=UPI0033D43744